MGTLQSVSCAASYLGSSHQRRVEHYVSMYNARYSRTGHQLQALLQAAEPGCQADHDDLWYGCVRPARAQGIWPVDATREPWKSRNVDPANLRRSWQVVMSRRWDTTVIPQARVCLLLHWFSKRLRGMNDRPKPIRRPKRFIETIPFCLAPEGPKPLLNWWGLPPYPHEELTCRPYRQR